MKTIDDEHFHELRAHVPVGPVRPFTEIQSRAQSLRKRRRIRQAALGAVVGVAGLAAVTVVLPGDQQAGMPATVISDDASEQLEETEPKPCFYSSATAADLPDSGRYLVRPEAGAPPLTEWHAATGPCGEDNVPVSGPRDAATAVTARPAGFGVIRISGPGADPVAPPADDAGAVRDVEIRGGTGKVHHPTDPAAKEAEVVNASWQEDGEYWLAHATGVSQAELLAALESLRFDGDVVVDWLLPSQYEVNLDTGPTPDEPTWRMSAVYANPEMPDGFYVDVSDRGPELIPQRNSVPVEIRAEDPTINGAGYLTEEPADGTWLVWKATDGRTFTLAGHIDAATAVRFAESLERVEPDHPLLKAAAD